MPEKHHRAWDFDACCCIATPKSMQMGWLNCEYLSLQLVLWFFEHPLCPSLIVGADAADQLRARNCIGKKE
jgi:hypothetical protein